MANLKIATAIINENSTTIKTTITDKEICTIPSTNPNYAEQFIEALIEAHFNSEYYIENLSELFDDLVQKSSAANEEYNLWFIRNYPQYSEYNEDDVRQWIWEARHYNYDLILKDEHKHLAE